MQQLKRRVDASKSCGARDLG